MTDPIRHTLNILIVGNLAPYRIGGAEVQARLLAGGLARRGHRVTVAGFGNPRGRIQVGGNGSQVIQTRPLRSIGRSRITRGLTYALSLMACLWRYRRRCDLVLCYMLGESDLVISLFKQLNVLHAPLVVCSAGFGPSGDAARLRSLPMSSVLMAMLKRQCNAINIISPSIEDELTQLGIDIPFSHIRNGVDLHRHRAASGRCAPERGSFLFVGRLVSLKGCADLLDAAGKLAAAGLRFNINIVGDGPRRGALMEQVAELGIEDRVAFHGAVHPDGVADHYRRNSILVLPSRREAQGMVVAEAMAFGLPVIVTRSGGPEHTVDRRMARICPANNPVALAAAMAEMLNMTEDELKAMGAAARRHAARHFDIETVVDRFIDLFEELTSRPVG